MNPFRYWFGISLFLVFALALLSDAQQEKKDAKTATEEPADLSEEEMKEQAIADRFRKVLDTNPRRGTALDRLYGYHVERGSLEKLIGEYATRTKADAKDGKAWLVIGLLEAQRGKDAFAVTAFRKAEELLTDNAIPSYYLGQSLVLVGQPEKAAEAFEKAITRKPNRNDLLDIFQALGRVYQRSQRSEKALDVWNRLEKLYPDDARVQEQIASTLVEEGEFAQALPRLEKLAKTTEDSYRKSSLQMEIADLKVRLKRTSDALADFEKLTSELNPESWLYRDVRRRIEDVFLKNDDLAGLAKYYEKWLEKNPTDIDAIARLAKNLATQGRAADARGWLEKGIAVAPTNRALRQALIDQFAFEQNYTAAAGQYELMDKNDPGNPDILREWGRLLMRDGSKPEADRKTAASAIWKKILEKKPKDAVVTSQVADLMRGANITDDAIALYRKAIELAPDAAQYREYLGEYFHSLKRSEEALATWRPIAEGANRNSKNLTRLAEVFSGFGYRKEAIETMGEAVQLENNDFTMRMTYAEFLHADSRNDDALKEIDAASKLVSNPEESEQILLAQIKIYQATEKLGDQINQLQKELDGGKDATGERYLRLARFHEANRQPELATESINKAAEKDPKSVPILIAAARIHESGGNLLAASDTNRKLAALDRRFRTEYLQAVAKLEQRLGRREQAMQAGRDLLAASPGNPDVYKFYADLCFQLGDQEEGLEALRRSVRANPSEPSGLVTLANALVERLRQGEAIELLWRAFEKTNELEGRLGLIDRLASLYLENNQFDKLIERLERERREAEKSREFSMCIAQAFQTAGDLGTARSQLERLLTENTRDGGLLDQLVQLCEKEGDVGSALKYQRLLVAALPNNYDHQLKLASLLTRSGEADEAAELWVKLVAGETEPHRNLGAIDQLINASKHDTALAILSRMIAQKPGNWELIYREGAILSAKGNKPEAAKRFESILTMKLSDDELGAQAKNQIAQQKKKQKQNPKAAAIAAQASRYDESLYAPLSRRTSNLYELQMAVGINPDNRYYGPGNQPRFWSPGDFGEARMACHGWLYEIARAADQQDQYVKQLRAARDKPNAEPRSQWDFYYLQLLRNDRKDLPKLTFELSKGNDPAGYLAFLNSLSGRGDPNRNVARRSGTEPKVDKTPPLPADQLTHALECYRKLRAIKPEWVERGVASTILLELKRAKNDTESKQIYQTLVNDANTVPRVTSAMGLAAERDDFDTVHKLFDKLQKLQGPVQTAAKLAQLPTRQVSGTFTTVMGKQMDAKKYDEGRKTLDSYLTTIRKENLSAPRTASARRSNQGGGYVYLYSQGKNQRYQPLPFPSPNEYYDLGTIQFLYNAFDMHKKADLLSDLHAHFAKQIEQAQGAEKLYLHLALGYLYWWGEDKEQALNQMTLATQAVPNDHNLILEVATLREQNNEYAAALELLDSITPLDHVMMQRREEAAMRVSERTGNVERAREAANRLFGMRLDANKQLELAGKMHRLGLHEMAETVLGRSHRQAGNNTATLLRLMNQYQSQNQGDLAVAIARQILRKAPSANFGPRNYDEGDAGRNQAVGVLARSGQLKDLIERAEAQLKTSPKSVQIHQALLDYYRAAGEKEKQKALALKMVDLKPEDGKFRYSMAQQLQQLGDTENALKQYVEAIRRDPQVFQYSYWQIEQLFSQAGKFEELSKLMDEIDLRKIGQPYYVTNTIQSLLQNENTQQLGMKLFKKAWAAFPTNRSELLQYMGEGQTRQLPEIYDYLREAIIPRADTEADPWSIVATINNYGQEGKVTSIIGQMLSIARKQHRLGELRKEVEETLAKKPDWHAGRAILGVIDVQSGKKEEGLKTLAKLFEEKKGEVPGMARFILTQELEYYAGAEELAVKILEAGVEDMLDTTDNQMEFEYNPLRRLVWWYQQLERPDDARKLLHRIAQTEMVDPGYSGGYWQYRVISQKASIARSMVQAGDPIEAIKLYSDILAHPEDIMVANSYYGGGSNQFDQMVEAGFRSAVKALKPETLPGAMKILLAPRTEAGHAALDLVVIIESRDLSKAKLGSVFQTALRATEKTPELRKEVVETLAKLAARYPKDYSVQIATALAAFLDAKPEVTDEAVERLTKLLDAVPLETLPPDGKANARQRDEARQQVALWLVARECLQKGRDKYADAGRKLAIRSLAAAKRQVEPIYPHSILREWGELEIARGDLAQGEARWSEMLELMLPKPNPKKPAAKTAPAKAPAPAAPSTTPPVPAKDKGTPEGDSPERSALDDEDDDPRFVRQIITKMSFGSTAPAASDPSMLTIDQFQHLYEYAKVTADKKLPALSLKAMKEALKGGPPLPSKNPNQGGGSYSSRMINGIQYYVREDGTNQTNPDGALAALVPKWRGLNVPPAEIYDVLATAVFPDARPAEVFLSFSTQGGEGKYYTISPNGSLMPASFDPVDPGQIRDLSQLLVQVAVEGKKEDDLRKRCESRMGQPLGELPANILLFLLAVETKDDAKAIESLKKLGARIEKDRVQTTLILVATAATRALEKPALEAAAEDLLLKVALSYAAANNPSEASNVGMRLIENKLKKDDREGAKKLIDTGRTLGKTLAANDTALHTRLGTLYLRAGYIPEALDEFGLFLDAQTSSAAADPRMAARKTEPTCEGFFQLYKGLLELPAAKRYEVLKNWTMPTSGRKSLRFYVGTLPRQLPPPAFVKYPAFPSDPLVSTLTLLIDTAKEVGKGDELIAAGDQLVQDKIENAETFRVLAYLSLGKGKAIEADVKQHAEKVYKRLTDKPAPRVSSRYYYDGEQQGPVTFRPTEYFFARLCLSDPAFVELSEKLSAPILEKGGGSSSHALRSLLDLNDQKIFRRNAAPEALTDGQPLRWYNAKPKTVWLAQDGLLANAVASGNSRLLLDVPLAGTYEWSIELSSGGYAGSNGVQFTPSGSQISETLGGNNEQAVYRPAPGLRGGEFNKLTFRVTPQKMTCLLNDKVWYEDENPAPTCPWVMLGCTDSGRHVFRNFTLSGNPEVPAEVKLLAGDYVEGWISPFYLNTLMPNRVAARDRKENPQRRYDRYGRVMDPDAEEEPVIYDWEAKDGVLKGRKLEKPTEQAMFPAHVSYFRPLNAGETIACEFFHKTGESHVHPTLGQLAFILDPEGIRWHWIASDTDNSANPGAADWLALQADHAVAPPAGYKPAPSKLALKDGDWNALKMSVGEKDFRLELNGAVVHEGPLPEGVDTRFGFFHYRNRTEARIRNVVLTGNWPKKLEKLDDLGFVAKPAAPRVAKARRELIGERNYSMEARNVLDRARKLAPAESYRLLAEWILPTPTRPVFQFGGSWKTDDVLGVVDRKEQPQGKRVTLGGRFESPVLELVKVAKELNRLDELAKQVTESDAAKGDDTFKRCQAALQILILIAKGKDADATAKLGELKKAVEGMPTNSNGHQRWPILLASLGAVERAELVKPATELADVMSRNIEKAIVDNQSFDDRDWWFKVFRFVRAQGQVKSQPEGVRRPFGSNDVFAHWTAAQGVTPGQRNGVSHVPHWHYSNKTLFHFPGFGDDYLILNSPLTGDFEVTCELLLQGWQECHIRYGGYEVRLDTDRKSFKLSTHVSEEGRKTIISPPLKDQESKKYAFKMTVKDGVVKFFIDDQEVFSERVGAGSDPWLMIRCNAPNTGEVRDLKITGTPRVPDRIGLTAGDDFLMWRVYQGGGSFVKRGEEMYHLGGKRVSNPYEPDEDDTPRQDPRSVFTEAAYYYQRPVVEDGSIEYEFYYSPDKTLVHPMFDRLVFLLEPTGVKLHWLTDGVQDKSGLLPKNSQDEPPCRRGPEQLPLKPKAWNKLRFQLTGDTVKLILNGTEVYERPVEATNQRLFGLFHYADQTEVRVRGMVYEGKWEKELPTAEKLFELKK